VLWTDNRSFGEPSYLHLQDGPLKSRPSGLWHSVVMWQESSLHIGSTWA